MADWPALGTALDRGQLTTRKALLLGRLRFGDPSADEPWLAGWIARAATLTVRELEVELRAATSGAEDMARASATGAVEGAPLEGEAPAPSPEDPWETRALRLERSAAGRWEAARRLHARLEGRDPSAAETLEAVVADYLSSATPAELEAVEVDSASGGAELSEVARAGSTRPSAAGRGGSGVAGGESAGDEAPPTPAWGMDWGFGSGGDRRVPAAERLFWEAALERETDRWAYLAEPSPGELHRELIRQLPDPAAFPTDPFALDRVAGQLLRLRQQRDAVLGRDARLLQALGLWREAGFLSFAHYLRERLGMGVRAVEQRTRLDRRLDDLPGLAAAFHGGELGYERTRLVAEVASERTCAAWLARAREVTGQELERQVTAAKIEMEAGLGLGEPLPPDSWPTAPPVLGSGTGGRGSPWEAQLCVAAKLEAASRAAAEGGGAQMCVAPAVESETGKTRGSGAFAGRALRLRAPAPVWALFEQARRLASRRVGRDLDDGTCLGLLVESFSEAWSAPELRPTRDGLRFAVGERDGWQCSAPGCTCRRNLAVHHVIRRSQGGGNEPWNLTLLCAAHHLEGVHGGRMRVTGRAPDALHWEMGLQAGEPLWVVHAGRLQVRD